MKKLLTLAMVLCLLFSVSLTVFAAEYTDTADHWAESAINQWTACGVVNGKGADAFDPDGQMTRAEAAQMFVNLLKLNDKADVSAFTDMDADAWYVDAISKCVAKGILGGVSDTEMDPNGTITREMFFVMFARALGIAPEAELTVPASDMDKTADWAAGYVNALMNKGFVGGVSTDATGAVVAPKLEINRASAVSLLSKTITGYAYEAGTTVTASKEGITLVVADNVTITGTGTANIVVAQDNADVSLKGFQGTPNVSVVSDGVAITNAPAGSTITAAEGTTGTTANGSAVSSDKPVEIPSAPSAPADPHAHSYTGSTATCTTDGVETCSCGATRPVKATGHSWNESTCANCGTNMSAAMKFQLMVSSNSTVSMVVFDDYSFQIVVPNGTVDAAHVSATVAMQNVDSLGVADLRSHTINVDTGITGHDAVPLQSWLSKAWTFDAEGEETNTIVNIDVAGNACAYKIFNMDTTGESAATIWGIPADIEATRTAWQELASHVETTSGLEDDSYIVIKNGSYLINGTEKLCFEDGAGDLKLDNFSNLSALKQNIKDAVKLDTVDDTNSIEACLKAGTELKVSSSSAVLKDTVTVTVDGITVDGALTDIRTAANSEGNYALAETLIQLVNGLMGSVQGQTVNVTVAFG